MSLVKKLWKKITHTNALDQASGESEIEFFEDVYRIAYAAGLSTTDRTAFYLMYSTVIKFMITIIICGEVWYTYSQALSLDDFAACVNVIVIQLITLLKFRNMINHRDIYQKLAKSMEYSYFDTTTETRKQLVRFWARTHAKFVKLLIVLGNCSLAAWHLYPLMDDVEYNLMIGVRLPFDYNTPVRYFFTYLFIGIAFTYTAHFVMVTDLVMQAHLVPLICQLSVLANCFENIIHDCKTSISAGIIKGDLASNKHFIKKYLTRLGNLVEQHKLILNYTLDLRAVLSGPMLGQLAASGTLICFVGYQAATTISNSLTKGLMSLFYLGYNLFGLYIICRWCEEITVQGYNVGEAIYCSKWECGMSVLPGVRSTILLVIVRANRPPVFTAGGMYNLSLNAFSTLVKTSYSALTVLLRFRHE